MEKSGGIFTMRAQGRSPPFLLIGLVVALGVLAFSYWNLSSRNGEMSTQVTNCQRELRLVSDKRDSAEKFRALTSQTLREYNDLNNKLKSQIQEKEGQLNDQNNKLAAKDSEISSCKSQADAMKVNVAKCEEDLTGTKNELQSAQEQLRAQKNTPQQLGSVPCDQKACANQLFSALSILTKSLGKEQILQALQQNGIDVSKLNDLPDQLKNAQNAGQNQPQPGQNQPQAGQGQNSAQIQAPVQPAGAQDKPKNDTQAKVPLHADRVEGNIGAGQPGSLLAGVGGLQPITSGSLTRMPLLPLNLQQQNPGPALEQPPLPPVELKQEGGKQHLEQFSRLEASQQKQPMLFPQSGTAENSEKLQLPPAADGHGEGQADRQEDKDVLRFQADQGQRPMPDAEKEDRDENVKDDDYDPEDRRGHDGPEKDEPK